MKNFLQHNVMTLVLDLVVLALAFSHLMEGRITHALGWGAVSVLLIVTTIFRMKRFFAKQDKE